MSEPLDSAAVAAEADEIAPIFDDERTLLILDDDDAFRTRLGRAMERRGFQPRLAESVAEARMALAGGALIWLWLRPSEQPAE